MPPGNWVANLLSRGLRGRKSLSIFLLVLPCGLPIRTPATPRPARRPHARAVVADVGGDARALDDLESRADDSKQPPRSTQARTPSTSRWPSPSRVGGSNEPRRSRHHFETLPARRGGRTGSRETRRPVRGGRRHRPSPRSLASVSASRTLASAMFSAPERSAASLPVHHGAVVPPRAGLGEQLETIRKTAFPGPRQLAATSFASALRVSSSLARASRRPGTRTSIGCRPRRSPCRSPGSCPEERGCPRGARTRPMAPDRSRRSP